MRWFKKKFNHQLSINCNALSERRNDYMYCFLALLHKGWAASWDLPSWPFVPAWPLRIHQSGGSLGRAVAHPAGKWQRSSCRAHRVIIWRNNSAFPQLLLGNCLHGFTPCLCRVDSHPWPMVSKFVPLLGVLNGSYRTWNTANLILFRGVFFLSTKAFV